MTPNELIKYLRTTYPHAYKNRPRYAILADILMRGTYDMSFVFWDQGELHMYQGAQGNLFATQMNTIAWAAKENKIRMMNMVIPRPIPPEPTASHSGHTWYPWYYACGDKCCMWYIPDIVSPEWKRTLITFSKHILSITKNHYLSSMNCVGAARLIALKTLVHFKDPEAIFMVLQSDPFNRETI